MKKTFKTLTAFLLLLSLITVIQPLSTSIDTNAETRISTCGNDTQSIESITNS